MPLRWPQEIQNDELPAGSTHQRVRPKARTLVQHLLALFQLLLQAEKFFFAKQSHLFPAAIARAKA
jgi:hypothetical protein